MQSSLLGIPVPKIKVMFVVLQLDAGGSERVVLELARGLDPLQFEIYVSAFNGGVLEASFRKVCKDIFFIKKGRRLDFPAMFEIAKIIRKHEIDVINAHHYMPCFYSFLGTKIINLKKLIYTEHSVPEVEGIASSIHGKIFFWMLFLVDSVIGVSREITEKFRVSYPWHAKKFITILNGVDIGRFEKRNNGVEIRRRLGLFPEHFVVGTVANFRKVKNHVCLLRAAAQLKDSHPQLRLIFVGMGFPGDTENSEAEVREKIEEFGLKDKVVLTGYQKNIPEMLSAFDVFCLPSFSEGLPVSVLEAMASRVPVIGSEVKGIIEVVKPGQTGVLFPPNDDGVLAGRIIDLMENFELYDSIKENAFDYVKEKHSHPVWVSTYKNIF